MNNDLFDNPLVRAAQESLSAEDKEKYRKIGESLYGSINFEDGTSNVESNLDECVDHIVEQIKSGLHPSMLEDSEKELMKHKQGEEWYLKYGYLKEDLTEIKTLK